MQYFFYSYVRRNGAILSNGARNMTNRTTNTHGTWQVMATEEPLCSGDVLDLIVTHCFDAAYIAHLNVQAHLSLRKIAGANITSTKSANHDNPVLEDEPVPMPK